jgi:hypothetical protein
MMTAAEILASPTEPARTGDIKIPCCEHRVSIEEECDECLEIDDSMQAAREAEEVAEAANHCIACNDSGESQYGEGRCAECSPRRKRRNRDEP